MSVEAVRGEFAARGLEYEVRELEEGTETVERAAAALGVYPALIAKTLAFRVREQVVLVVTRGDARIDNRKFKQAFGAKPRMLGVDEVEEITGHAVGGVCPFGLRNPLAVSVDESLRPFAEVYPAAGSGNSCIAISPDELVAVTGGTWVDVCRDEG